MLTTGTDSFVGTADNDLFTSAAGTLASADTILDSSSTDSDILNAEVTSNSAAPRLQNIETINLTGKYTTVGMDLASTSGTQTLNLDSTIANGTATVTNAASLNAVNIVASSNIDTLSVTATASGTRDAVYVDASNASTVTVAGGAGADIFDVTLGAGATATLNGGGSIDAYTVNVGSTATLTGNTVTEAITINSDANSVVTLGGVLTDTVTNVSTAKTTITGAGDITVKGTNTQLTDTAIVNNGSGTLTVQVTDAAVAADLKAIVADYINLAVDPTVGTVTVNEGSVVNLMADSTTTLQVDNVDGDLTTGTLLLNVSEDSTSITTGNQVETVLITATPDEVTDTDSNENGIADTQITIADLDLNAATTTAVVQGAEDLKITTLTNNGSETLAASGMTGALTIGDTIAAITMALGSGDDVVLDTADGAAAIIYGNGGNDTITTGTGNDKIYGGAGDDTIAAGTGTNTIDAGTGNDTITVTGTDTITTGTGNDTIISAVNLNYTVTDIDTTNDTLVLTGAATTAVDLTSVTPSTGAYKVSNTGGAADFTLTGSTATDISSFVQLGNSTTAFTAAAGLNVKAGAKNDVIAVDGANTITTGAGSDTVIVASAETTAIVADFTAGSDKVILTGALTSDASINLGSVTITSNEHVFAGTHEVTLKSDATTYITATDVSSMVQLGTSAVAFATAGTAAVSVTGGSFNDFISLGSTAANTVNFIDNGGMDTISSFTTTTDKLSFDGMTGISATAGTTAATTKIADAQDGSVYVFGNVVTTAYAGEKVSTFTVDTDGNTADTILADVAALLEASLGEADGENYIAIMNDGTSSYAYLVNADADGIDAADITLIGKVDTGVVAVGDIA